jgi:hypothetical protein
MDISDIICKKELSDEEMSAEIKKRLEAMNPPVDPEESKSDVCEELIEWVINNEYRRTELVAWFDLSPSQAEHVLDVIQKGRIAAMSKVIMTLSLAQVHRARIAMEMDMANATEKAQKAETVKQEMAADDGHNATAEGAPSVVYMTTNQVPAHMATSDEHANAMKVYEQRIMLGRLQKEYALQQQQLQHELQQHHVSNQLLLQQKVGQGLGAIVESMLVRVPSHETSGGYNPTLAFQKMYK